MRNHWKKFIGMFIVIGLAIWASSKGWMNPWLGALMTFTSIAFFAADVIDHHLDLKISAGPGGVSVDVEKKGDAK